jgi:hypothetical protein
MQRTQQQEMAAACQAPQWGCESQAQRALLSAQAGIHDRQDLLMGFSASAAARNVSHRAHVSTVVGSV